MLVAAARPKRKLWMTNLRTKSGGAALGRKERIDRAMQGAGVDRPPFSFSNTYAWRRAKRTPRPRSTSTAVIGRIW